jgi:hypothetical protein
MMSLRTARPPMASSARRPWTIAWAGGAALGVVNGTIRQAYAGIGERRAHQVSTGTLIGALAIYFWALDRRWPTRSLGEALQIGAAWAALTVAFEVALGRYGPERKSWREILEAYDLVRGELWPLVLAWEIAGPAAVRARRISVSEGSRRATPTR